MQTNHNENHANVSREAPPHPREKSLCHECKVIKIKHSRLNQRWNNWTWSWDSSPSPRGPLAPNSKHPHSRHPSLLMGSASRTSYPLAWPERALNHQLSPKLGKGTPRPSDVMDVCLWLPCYFSRGKKSDLLKQLKNVLNGSAGTERQSSGVHRSWVPAIPEQIRSSHSSSHQGRGQQV